MGSPAWALARLEDVAADPHAVDALRLDLSAVEEERLAPPFGPVGAKRTRVILDTTDQAMPCTRTHPGEILTEEFMKPHRLDTAALALDVPEAEIAAVACGRQPVTAALAAGLARRFGMTAQFWLNLQSTCTASNAGE